MSLGHRGIHDLPTTSFTIFETAMFPHCRRRNLKWKQRGRKGSYAPILQICKVLPQLNSSEPSEQSGLKSHTWLSATHSPWAPHTNCPSGQLWGWRVGAGVVTAGMVWFTVGRFPKKFWKMHVWTWTDKMLQCIGHWCKDHLRMVHSSWRRGHRWQCRL